MRARTAGMGRRPRSAGSERRSWFLQDTSPPRMWRILSGVRCQRSVRVCCDRSGTVNRFERAFGILLLLRSGNRLSATELARRFEVSIRTIYRDVDMLGMLGVPVIAEAGRNGGFRLQEGYFLPPVMFSLGEAVSLLLGAAMLRGLRVRPFAADLDSGEEKLVAAMPSHLRSVL